MDQIKEQLMQIIFKIRNFGILATARMDNAHPAGVDINLPEFFLMKRVSEAEPVCRFNLLAMQNSLSISKSGVSKLLSALEKKGYLARDTDKNNRRNIVINLTTKGYGVIGRLERLFDEYLMEYINHLEEDDLNQMIAILGRLERAGAHVREKLRRKFLDTAVFNQGEE